MTDAKRPMPRLSLIGAGQLGKTLAYLLHHHALCQIDSVVTLSPESAERACTFIGTGKGSAQVDPDSALILIAVPDDAIRTVCEALVRKGIDLQDKTLFHCSGSLSSAALSSARDAGAAVASVHPVFSFADPAAAVERFRGTPCGIEGDSEAIAIVQPLFEALGATCSRIDAEAKSLYHCAAVMANNYTVGLQFLAARLYERSGMSREQAMGFILPILQGTVDNIASLGIEKALTGPVARHDIATIERHLQALAQGDSITLEAYKALGLACCDLLDADRPDSHKTTEAIRKQLG